MSDIAGSTEMVLGGGHVLSGINPGTLIRGLFGRSGLWGLGKLHAYDSRHVEIFWRYIASTSWDVPPLDPNVFSVLCTYVMTQIKAAHAKVAPEHGVMLDTRTRSQSLDSQTQGGVHHAIRYAGRGS